MKTLEETTDLIRRLPPELKQEVDDFVEFLRERRSTPKRNKPRLDWAGGLSQYRDKFTSVELQHKAMDWWGGRCSCWTLTSGQI
jgi:hypothetical protein